MSNTPSAELKAKLNDLESALNRVLEHCREDGEVRSRVLPHARTAKAAFDWIDNFATITACKNELIKIEDVRTLDLPEAFEIEFWNTDSYENYDDAKANGAVYKGEICYGKNSFWDAMCNCRAVATCLVDKSPETLMVRVVIDKKYVWEGLLTSA